nr:pheromone receptor [Rhizopogon roseolus]
MHPEFPSVAFLAALSLLLPLPWHWRARNVATLSIIAWLFVLNVAYGVDAIVWGDNVKIVIPVWCDISAKIIMGATFALPAACLCICIHLERVASVRQAQTTHSDKRRRQLFELLMCFGLPMIFMGLHYIVQGHRFDIIEEYGCRPTTYVSIPAIFLIWVPPLLLSVIALGFACAAFVHFMKRRITFARHLESSRNGLTTSRYFRLMLMAVVEMIWNIMITSYTLWFSTMDMRPWTNWDNVHSNFSRIDLYATLFTPRIVLSSFYLIWWIIPASTFIFVAFFAFGKDAVEEYKACIVWVRRNILKQTVDETVPGSFGSIPIAKYVDVVFVDSMSDILSGILAPSCHRHLQCLDRKNLQYPHPQRSPKSIPTIITPPMMRRLLFHLLRQPTMQEHMDLWRISESLQHLQPSHAFLMCLTFLTSLRHETGAKMLTKWCKCSSFFCPHNITTAKASS